MQPESHRPNTRRTHRVRVVTAGVTVAILAALVAVALPAAATAGDTISGTVWQDYDSNGQFGGSDGSALAESGLTGIEVTAFDDAGNRAGPVVTDSDGDYSLELPSDASRWRVEANVPETAKWANWEDSVVGTEEPDANGTTVQFAEITDGSGASGVDFSFEVPSDHVEHNPMVWLPVYRYGAHDGAHATSFGGVAHRYDAMSAGTQSLVPLHLKVPFSQVGTTYGTAWQRAQSPGGLGQLFTAATVQRHGGLGPGGIGAIYRVDPPGGTLEEPTASAELLVDLTDWGIDLGDVNDPDAEAGDPNGLRPIDTSDNPSYDWRMDAQAFDKVGRIGLGALAISPDNRSLWVTNLHHRSIVRIDISPDGKTVRDVEEFDLTDTLTDDEDMRVFGLSESPLTGEMFLAVTYTAEASQDRDDLHAYVYSFRPDAPQDLRRVLDFPLNYTRGLAGFQTLRAEYNPWYNDPAVVQTRPWSGPIHLMGYPTPQLSDVRYLHGDLIIGIRDQSSSVSSYDTFVGPGLNTPVYNRAVGGEMLKAGPNGDGTYSIEDNGVVNGVKGTGSGVSSFTSGPTGPDKFFRDHWTTFAGRVIEHLGSMVVIPTRQDGILETGIHVAGGGWQVGTRRFEQSAGNFVGARGALVMTGQNVRGANPKGNSLGELTLMSAAAPIEIGNFVWYDVDNDGIQDPGEEPVPGATVSLYETDHDGARTLVAQTVTDAHGQYYFSSDVSRNNDTLNPGSPYALRTFTDYAVGIDNPDDYASGGPLDGWHATERDLGDASSSDRDRNDSDGRVDPQESDYPYAEISTGGPGQNDHSIDFGYSRIDYSFDKSTADGPRDNGDGTWTTSYDLTVQNSSPDSGPYTLTDDLSGYGKEIEIVSTRVVSGPEGAPLNADWNGRSDTRVITSQHVIEPAAGNDPTVHTYRLEVTVRFATAPDGTPDVDPRTLTCTAGQQTGEATTGLFNSAALKANSSPTLHDEVCDSLTPRLPAPPPGPRQLPDTGSPVAAFATPLGLALLVAGVALVRLGRERVRGRHALRA